MKSRKFHSLNRLGRADLSPGKNLHGWPKIVGEPDWSLGIIGRGPKGRPQKRKQSRRDREKQRSDHDAA